MSTLLFQMNHHFLESIIFKLTVIKLLWILTKTNVQNSNRSVVPEHKPIDKVG